MSRAICVLGMMRTGTSAVAGVLELLGVHFGPEERLLEPNVANPTGFREHESIIALNDELLARLGGAWYAPPDVHDGWEDDRELNDLRRRAAAIIESHLATHAVWGWKDPRTCLTLPFWRMLVPDLIPVVCLRGPVETARSVVEMGEMGWTAVDRLEQPFETALDLWLRYTTDVLDHTRGQARLLVVYDELLDAPVRESGRLATFTGMSERLTPVCQEAIEEFLRRTLRHHVARADPQDRSGEHPADDLYARLLRERE